MEVCERIIDARQKLSELRRTGKKVGLVPTMGYLHQGHMSLIERAKAETDFVVTSIFVNPIQFGPSEDFAKYPRDLSRDCELAASAGADLIFAPTVSEMYPNQIITHVDVAELGDWMCGKARPGHFRGVTTVVSKLFNIIQPDKAYFGQKDAQQLAIITQMVRDLNFPVEIVPVPIVREVDGLALSSRNVYLSSEERAKALVLNRALVLAKDAFLQGERDGAFIKNLVCSTIEDIPGSEIDYVEVCDMTTMQPVDRINSKALVALAVRFGKTRLIDNILLLEE